MCSCDTVTVLVSLHAAGVGIALMFGPSLTVIGIYFEKRRSLANGMAMAGGSVGLLIMPVLLNRWLHVYGLSGTLLIYASFMLHGLIGASLMRPTSFYDSRRRHTPQATTLKTTHLKEAEAEAEAVDRCRPNSAPDNDALEGCTVSEAHITSEGPPQKRSSTAPVDAPDRCITPTHTDSGGATKGRWWLFREPLFFLYVIAVCCGNVGYIDTILFLPVFAQGVGVGQDTSATLLIIIGGCDLVARLFGGWLADRRCVRRSVLASLCMAAMAVVTIVTASSTSITTAVIFSISVGVFGGMYCAVFAVVLIDFLGLSAFSQAFGLTVMFMGIGNSLVPATIGKY